MARRPSIALATAGAALGLLAATAAQPAELRLSERPYDYAVIDQDLRDALRQFGANTRLRVELSEGVRGRVRGRVTTASPRRFLDALAADHGLDWYYDGFKLYVNAGAEDVSKFISVPRDLGPAFRAALESGGIADPRFPLRGLAGTDSLIVSGPPRFVSLVEQAAAALVPKSADGPDTVTVYRGSAVQRTEIPKPVP